MEGWCRRLGCVARGVLCSPPLWAATRRKGFFYRRHRVAAEDSVDPLTKATPIDKAVLHVVSVPIGNLKDFSIRALDVLHDVDYIVCSNRPATRTLLDLVRVPSQGRLIHYSQSNLSLTCEKLVELLRGGRSMALVTTSGTPCVGDVGAGLVQAMQAHGVRVTAVPGPSAVMSALAICGVTSTRHDLPISRTGDAAAATPLVGAALSSDGSFFFGNLLPTPHGARLRLLREVVAPACFPCVFYEVPRRLLLVLQDIALVLPTRRVFILHELTRMNESLHADTAERLVRFYLRPEAQVLHRKGQVVLVIAGAGPQEEAIRLERETRKRRKLRRGLQELTMTPGPSPPASPAPSDATCDKPKATRRLRRAALQRLRRVRLIRAIEKEQERLRLRMATNISDAEKPLESGGALQ